MSFFAAKPKDPARCYAMVSFDSWHYHQCRNKWVVERDVPDGLGRPLKHVRLCKTHDPVAIEARKQRRGPTRLERDIARLDLHAKEGEMLDKIRRIVDSLGPQHTFEDAAVALNKVHRVLRGADRPEDVPTETTINPFFEEQRQ